MTRLTTPSRPVRKLLLTVAAALPLLLASTARAEVDKKIERSWKANCASCHANDGTGKTEKGEKMKIADMTSPAWQKANSDDLIKKAILEGVNETKDGVKKEMDSYKEKVKPEQMDGLIAFIRAFAK